MLNPKLGDPSHVNKDFNLARNEIIQCFSMAKQPVASERPNLSFESDPEYGYNFLNFGEF